MSEDLPRTAPLPSSPPGTAVIRTLLVTDLVDSTALFARLGDRRTAEVSQRHDAVARALLIEHGGREIDKSDGFLLLFERPLDAVAYALAYHRALADLSRELNVVLQARAGIHVGEVFLRENPPESVVRGAKPLEVEGLAKATAARVMSLALGRQTLLTHGAFDLARRGAIGELEIENLRWLDHGAYSLKGVDEPVDVYEVGIVGFSPLINPVDRTKAVRVAEPRLSAAGAGSVGLAARRARRRRHAAAIAAVGVVAIVAVILIVSWRDGDAASGRPAGWLASAEAEVQPYELYALGMRFLERYDRDGHIEEAIASFQRILARDESSAPAHAGLARAYWHQYSEKSRDRQLLEQGLANAQRAVSLDGHLAAARVALGLIYNSLGQPAEAEGQLERALALEPASAEAHWGLGQVYESRNELEQAEAAYLEAAKRQPGNWLFPQYLGVLYFKSARYEEAEEAFLRCLELAPDLVGALRNLAGICFLQGRESEAASLLQQAIAIRPDPSLYANLGTILFYQGLYQEAASTFEKAMAGGGAASNQHLMWGNLGDAYRWTPDGQGKAREAYQRAIQLVREEMESTPEKPGLQSRLALFQAKRGDAEQALATLSAIDEGAQLGPYAGYRIAVAYEILGKRDDALDALAGALRAGFSTQEVGRDPELLELRSDPRYHRLMLTLESEAEASARPHG